MLQVISCKQRHGAQQLTIMEQPASDLQTVGLRRESGKTVGQTDARGRREVQNGDVQSGALVRSTIQGGRATSSSRGLPAKLIERDYA